MNNEKILENAILSIYEHMSFCKIPAPALKKLKRDIRMFVMRDIYKSARKKNIDFSNLNYHKNVDKYWVKDQHNFELFDDIWKRLHNISDNFDFLLIELWKYL